MTKRKFEDAFGHEDGRTSFGLEENISLNAVAQESNDRTNIVSVQSKSEFCTAFSHHCSDTSNSTDYKNEGLINNSNACAEEILVSNHEINFEFDKSYVKEDEPSEDFTNIADSFPSNSDANNSNFVTDFPKSPPAILVTESEIPPSHLDIANANFINKVPCNFHPTIGFSLHNTHSNKTENQFSEDVIECCNNETSYEKETTDKKKVNVTSESECNVDNKVDRYNYMIENFSRNNSLNDIISSTAMERNDIIAESAVSELVFMECKRLHVIVNDSITKIFDSNQIVEKVEQSLFDNTVPNVVVNNLGNLSDKVMLHAENIENTCDVLNENSIVCNIIKDTVIVSKITDKDDDLLSKNANSDNLCVLNATLCNADSKVVDINALEVRYDKVDDVLPDKMIYKDDANGEASNLTVNIVQEKPCSKEGEDSKENIDAQLSKDEQCETVAEAATQTNSFKDIELKAFDCVLNEQILCHEESLEQDKSSHGSGNVLLENEFGFTEDFILRQIEF